MDILIAKRHTDLITWVSNKAWMMLLSEFNDAIKINHVREQQYAITVNRVI